MDKAADDAASTHWLDIAMVNGKLQLTDGDKTLYHDDLAFDHWEILLIAMERIREDSNTAQLFSTLCQRKIP